MFYFKLAWANIRKNKNTYLPFLGSMIFLVILNLLIQVMTNNEGIQTLPSAATVRSMFGFGSWVITIFSVIFAFYTNSFLIKRRQKELGLYNILGMDKRSLGVMLLVENLLSMLLTLGIGLLFGSIFSKYLFLVMKKLTGLGEDFTFQLTVKMLLMVAVVFIGLYTLLLLYNFLQLAKTNPIELLHGSNVGEKEPKAHWILTIAGILCLGAGYYFALTVKDPVSALPTFFGAILLVIIGTYLILITASVTILKFLRKRKGLYYKPKAFVNISGMIYRMKQNGAGLASICILSTMVLVTVSSTAGLFFGRENVIENRNPTDISFTTQLENKDLQAQVTKLAEENNVTVDETYDLLQAETLMLTKKEDKFVSLPQDAVSFEGACGINVLTLADYTEATGKTPSLQSDEVLVFIKSGAAFGKKITIGDQQLKVKGYLKELPFVSSGRDILDAYILVVKDENVTEKIYNSLQDEDGSPLKPIYGTNLMMNISGSKTNRMNFGKALRQLSGDLDNAHANDDLPNKNTNYSNADSIDLDREDNLTWTGGFLFIGVIFGLTFAVATALIIYYKQISEGYQDAYRFDIMQKVGMSHKEVKQTILSQILMVFLIPIILAVIHLTVAMPIIKKLLVMFGLTDDVLINGLTVLCVVIFAICYMLIYWLTSKSYYRIVEREA